MRVYTTAYEEEVDCDELETVVGCELCRVEVAAVRALVPGLVAEAPEGELLRQREERARLFVQQEAIPVIAAVATIHPRSRMVSVSVACAV